MDIHLFCRTLHAGYTLFLPLTILVFLKVHTAHAQTDIFLYGQIISGKILKNTGKDPKPFLSGKGTHFHAII